MTGGLLVAGIGNIFLSDDGFGVEVVSRLAEADLPAGVRVTDYGIRGMHLAYDLASYEKAILIDAAPRSGGDPPGTVYVIEPDLPPRTSADPPQAHECPVGTPMGVPTGHSSPGSTAPEANGADGVGGVGGADTGDPALAASPFFDAHGMQPDVVFSMLGQLTDQRPSRILVVGCEPATVEYGMGLSEPVASAVDEAVRVVLSLIAEQTQQTQQTEQAASGSGPLLVEE